MLQVTICADERLLGAGEPSVETLMPAVVIRDSASKALFAHVIPGKGLDYDWTAQQVAADIGRMGYPRIVIRSDQEPAITAMVDRVKAIRDEQGKETDVEWLPNMTVTQTDTQSEECRQQRGCSGP